MGIIVQKFGGTSVGTPEKIKNAAERIIDEKRKDNDVAVVVSAMGKTTDHLLEMAANISSHPDKRETDMLLSTGEQVTIALLAMALQEKGYDAVSFTGWQAGIKTEAVHGRARIIETNPRRIKDAFREGKIAVVAGFQGISETDEITTLGRGGSDTTAVALAVALNADRCDIFTDVSGVFTADPRYVQHARQLSSVSYDEMLELANLGAGVLHPRAVEFAKNYQIPLTVRTSLEHKAGTIIEEEVTMEKNLIVRGIAFEKDITRITVFGLPSEIYSLPAIFSLLAEEHINVDIIIQNTSEIYVNNVSFSVKNEDLETALHILEKNKTKVGYDHIEWESGLAKVSIVGSGMISNPGVAAKMFASLAEKGIFIKMVSTSEIKVSVVVDGDKMIEAAKILHEAFSLGSALELTGKENG